MMIVGCSFGRWGRSLSEHSGILRTLALLQFLRIGRLFPAASGLSNNPTSSLHGSFVGCLGPNHLQVISSQRCEADCGLVPRLHAGNAEVKKTQALPLRRGFCLGCHYWSLQLPQQPLSHLSALLTSLPSSIHSPFSARGISEMQFWFSIFRGLHSALKMSTRILGRMYKALCN